MENVGLGAGEFLKDVVQPCRPPAPFFHHGTGKIGKIGRTTCKVQCDSNDVCTLPRMTKVLPEAMRLALQLEGWCEPHVMSMVQLEAIICMVQAMHADQHTVNIFGLR